MQACRISTGQHNAHHMFSYRACYLPICISLVNARMMELSMPVNKEL